MIKVLLTVRRKPGLTVGQFRDYYEGNHAPLAVRTLTALRKYARNYLESSFGERSWLAHTGDLYHFAAERRLGRIPDAEKASGGPVSRARIDAIVAHERAQLWIGHDLASFHSTRKFPRFYD